MENDQVLAQRTYTDGEETFTVGIKAPYQEGNDWFCEVFVSGSETEETKVGGVDPLQAIRLAFPVLDSIDESHPNAESLGIKGAF